MNGTHERAGGERRQGLSIRTLTISSLAAVSAAVVVPLFWERGTLFATAMTPIVVAVASEMLSRPVTRIETVVRAPRVLGSGGEPAETAAETAETPAEAGAEPDADSRAERAPRAGRRRLKIAVATGALAFVIVAAVLTLSELAAGGQVTGDGRTTLFGGGGGDDRERDRDDDDERVPGQEDDTTAPAPLPDEEAEPTDEEEPPPTETTPEEPAPVPESDSEAPAPAPEGTPAPVP